MCVRELESGDVTNNIMITIKIEVVGHNGESLAEIERAVEYDIVKNDNNSSVVTMFHPNNDLGIEAINKAEDFMNANPELWARESEDNNSDHV